jgi:ferredoxin
LNPALHLRGFTATELFCQSRCPKGKGGVERIPNDDYAEEDTTAERSKLESKNRQIGLARRKLARHIRRERPLIKKVTFMADLANKYEVNVPGKYYVDNQCIDCDLCRETAPDNFKRNEDGGYSFVYKQPESPEEEARCKEAKEGCPVEAIGDNGA